MKSHRTATVVLVLAICRPFATACTILPTPKPAANTFILQLDGNARSSGIRLSLAGPVKQSLVTDAQGRVQFRGLPSGIYSLEGPGIFAWDLVDVKKGGPPELKIEWPQLQLLVTKSIKGRLTNGTEPIEPHELVLKSATTDRVLARTRTAADGTFNFAKQPDGPYVLVVKGRNKQDWYEGPILLAVDEGASTDTLDLQVGASSCGLSYSGDCPASTDIPVVSTLSGRVTDFSGAVIAGARVVLTLTSDPTHVINLAADSNGEFDFKDVRDGTYSLRITARVFAVFSTELTTDRSAAAGRLTVGLALLGSCKNSVEFRSVAKNISAENSKGQSTQR